MEIFTEKKVKMVEKRDRKQISKWEDYFKVKDVLFESYEKKGVGAIPRVTSQTLGCIM